MEGGNKQELTSWQVRAGRRSYFFDVKATKGQDLFMTITESKRVSHDDEEPRFEKHKIFLYKEDFEGFAEGFTNALTFIRDKQGKEGFRGADSNRGAGNYETSEGEAYSYE